jgi:hypothetical protein
MNIKTNMNDKHILKCKSILKTLQNIYIIVVQNCVLNIRFVLHLNYTLNDSLILLKT